MRRCVDEHAARGRIVETGDQIDERGLAGARLAENAEFRTGRDMEVDVFENRRSRIVGESEADVLEFDVTADTFRIVRSRRLRDTGFRLVADLIDDCHRLFDGFLGVRLLLNA